MKYLVCARPYSGVNMVSDELTSHHEKGFTWWDCSCMNPNITTDLDDVYYFDNPDALYQYLEAHKDEVFHLIYIYPTDEISRRMYAAKQGLEFDSQEEFDEYFKEENKLFQDIEDIIINHNTDKQLPDNISAVLNYQMDFTPPCISKIASNIIAQKIGFENTKRILDKAIACEIISADAEGNILSPTEDDPSHRIHPDITCDILMSDSNQLGELISRLIYDENLFN